MKLLAYFLILFTTSAIADTYIEKSGKKKAQSVVYDLPMASDHI
jgi:hypothetical protein